MGTDVDHLVVAARTLDEGVAWCNAVLGVTPTQGGKHALMGTHNRVLRIATAEFPRAYLEVIAIDPHAPAPPHARWFDLDDSALQARLATGPQLVHWVARCDDLPKRLHALKAAGHDVGDAVGAERETPQGVLRWQISIREDGRRQVGGVLPALIEWRGMHPCDALPDSGITLKSLELLGLSAEALSALQCGPPVSTAASATPQWRAVLQTPRGEVCLQGV